MMAVNEKRSPVSPHGQRSPRSKQSPVLSKRRTSLQQQQHQQQQQQQRRSSQTKQLKKPLPVGQHQITRNQVSDQALLKKTQQHQQKQNPQTRRVASDKVLTAKVLQLPFRQQTIQQSRNQYVPQDYIIYPQQPEAQFVPSGSNQFIQHSQGIQIGQTLHPNTFQGNRLNFVYPQMQLTHMPSGTYGQPQFTQPPYPFQSPQTTQYVAGTQQTFLDQTNQIYEGHNIIQQYGTPTFPQTDALVEQVPDQSQFLLDLQMGPINSEQILQQQQQQDLVGQMQTEQGTLTQQLSQQHYQAPQLYRSDVLSPGVDVSYYLPFTQQQGVTQQSDQPMIQVAGQWQRIAEPTEVPSTREEKICWVIGEEMRSPQFGELMCLPGEGDRENIVLVSKVSPDGKVVWEGKKMDEV